MAISAKMTLDALDLKILAELQTEARIPNIVLAEKVGLSPSPCSRRVKILEEAGVIEGYRAIIDRNALGLSVTVFASVRVERHSQDNADVFIAAIRDMPEVIACHLVSGDSDFLLEVVVADIASYEATVLRRLLSLPTVRDIRSSFALRSYKANAPIPIKPPARSS
jgi:Lrp/AsnC family transcriptional regulator, leucine-responsive regulatory protein